MATELSKILLLALVITVCVINIKAMYDDLLQRKIIVAFVELIRIILLIN